MKAPRCMYCGRFIALRDFINRNANFEYTPDTVFSYELTEFYHERCRR